MEILIQESLALLKDVNVVITDSSGESQMLTTDKNGEYSTDIPAGPAIIDIDKTTLPSGAVQTMGSNPTEVDIPAGSTATDQDGFQLTGKVKGTVFEDKNGNGRKEPNEPGIAGVDIVITDSTGESQTVITNNSSMYMATVLVGPTSIEIDENMLPPGAEQTAGENPLTVVVSPGKIVTDEDGFQLPAPPTRSPPTSALPTMAPPTPTGKVTGVVFEDRNGNGRKDPGEPGIEGIDVISIDSSGKTQMITTNENGKYNAIVPYGPVITDIDENTLPPGAVQTAGDDPMRLDVPAGSMITNKDGFQFPAPPTREPPTPTRAPPNREPPTPTRAPPTREPSTPTRALPTREPPSPTRALPTREPPSPTRALPTREPSTPTRALPTREPSTPTRAPPTENHLHQPGHHLPENHQLPPEHLKCHQNPQNCHQQEVVLMQRSGSKCCLMALYLSQEST